MEQVMEKIKNTKILAIISSICFIIAVFLPYVVVEFWGISESESMINYWEGIFVLIFAIINVLIVFVEFIEKQFPQVFKNDIVKKVLGLGSKVLTFAPVIGIVAMVVIFHLNRDMEFGSDYMHYGFGFWLLLIGSALQIAYAVLYKKTATPVTSEPKKEDTATETK